MGGYKIIVEKAKGNFSAYAPALPGCVATGATEAETRRNMQEAIRFHLEGCAPKKPVNAERPKRAVVHA
jgi:predicted RNase H-like HicB family nuclease